MIVLVTCMCLYNYTFMIMLNRLDHCLSEESISKLKVCLIRFVRI